MFRGGPRRSRSTPPAAMTGAGASAVFPQAMNGGSTPQPFTTAADQPFRDSVPEDLTHAWYKGSGPQHPWKGTTESEYTDFDDQAKYTWVRAPRYTGKPMQVGPLSNVLVAASLRSEQWRQLNSLSRSWAAAPSSKSKLPREQCAARESARA